MSLAEAQSTLLELLKPLQTEYCGLINALGRTVSEDLKAPDHVPPCNTALVDGYAVRAADTAGASESSPAVLGVLSDSPSRRVRRLEPGTVARVRKHGWLPEEADAVVTAPRVFRQSGDPRIFVLGEARPGENVQPAGSFAEAGEVIVRMGTRIGPGEMALAAAVGAAGVAVTRKPRLAVITAGRELIDPADKPADGQARNVSRYQLAGMAMECGCELDRLEHAADGRAGIERAIHNCATCDAILVATNERLGTEPALGALQSAGELVFERVRMSPGGHSACFGFALGKPVFVVPEQWAVEVFEALVRPGLLAMMGRCETNRPLVFARAGANIRSEAGFTGYVRAVTDCAQGQITATPLSQVVLGGWKWAQPNSLIVIPENTQEIRRGNGVEVLLLI